MPEDSVKKETQQIKDLKREIAEDYKKIDKLESRKYIQIIALLMGIMIMIFLFILLSY